MITKKQAERWLSLHPNYRKRSMMYEATALYLGITAEQVEKAITFHRRLQDILPNDAKGATLEKEWRAEEGMESVFDLAEKSLGGRRIIERNGQKYYLPR